MEAAWVVWWRCVGGGGLGLGSVGFDTGRHRPLSHPSPTLVGRLPLGSSWPRIL